MIYFLIIIGIIVGILYATCDGWYDTVDVINGGICGGFLGLLLTFVCAVGIFAYVSPCTLIEKVESYENKKSTEEQIMCLKDNINDSGSFYLGSGHIDTDSYYFYITYSEYGVIQNKLKTEYCFVMEDTEKNAYIETIELTQLKGHKVAKLLIGDIWEDTVYVFHIPKNSIITDFVIDCE